MTAESPEKDEEFPSSRISSLSSPFLPPSLRKSIPSSDFRRKIKLYKNSLKSSALAHVNLNFSSQLAAMAQLSAHHSLVARAKAKVDTSPPVSMSTPLGRRNEKTKLRIQKLSGSLAQSAASTLRSGSARGGYSPAQSSLLERMDQFLAGQQCQLPLATVSLSDKILHFLQSIQDQPPADSFDQDDQDDDESSRPLDEDYVPSRLSSLSLSSEALPVLDTSAPRYPHTSEWTLAKPASHSRHSTFQRDPEELRVQFKTDLTRHILRYQAFTDRSLLQVCQLFRKRYQHKMSPESMDSVVGEMMADLHISIPQDT